MPNKQPETHDIGQNRDLLAEYIENTKRVLNDRYKDLIEARQQVINIADRYDLSIAIDELKTIYELLFKKEV